MNFEKILNALLSLEPYSLRRLGIFMPGNTVDRAGKKGVFILKPLWYRLNTKTANYSFSLKPLFHEIIRLGTIIISIK